MSNGSPRRPSARPPTSAVAAVRTRLSGALAARPAPSSALYGGLVARRSAPSASSVLASRRSRFHASGLPLPFDEVCPFGPLAARARGCRPCSMLRTTRVRPTTWLPALVTAALLAGAAPAAANVPLTRVSADPFTNATSQHATEVEPDTFASGCDVRRDVPGRPVLQRRRLRHRLCPLLATAARPGTCRASCRGSRSTRARSPTRTARSSGSATRASPSTREHDTWMISSIPLLPNLDVPTVFVSRSTDGGATFGEPGPDPAARRRAGQPRQELDGLRQPPDAARSTATATPSSTTSAEGDLEYMSTSTDGGRPGARRSRPPATPRASAASRSCSPTAP